MKHTAETVLFESVDIRALADDELDDIVGGSIFEGKTNLTIIGLPGGPGLPRP